MKKQGLKLTGKVLTGLVLLSGVTALPTKAVDVQPAAVDVNVKNVKASVYEKEGHFYAKLVADKEVANVVARITTETKAEFLIKRDIIKAGEEVVVELDLNAQVPTRKLPHTGVKKESFNTVNELAGHTFKISVTYEIATDEVKAQQKANNDQKNKTQEELKNKTKVEKNEKPTDVPSIADLIKKTAPTVETKAPAVPVENTTKPAETPKPNTGNLAPSTAPSTPEDTKPSTSPLNLGTTPVTPVKTVMTNTPAPKDVVKVDPKKVETPVASVAATREEQIKQAFLAKVAQLRSINELPALTPNAALNVSSLKRSKDVSTSVIDGNIHGPNGSIQYEKDSARAAGYNGSILANVAISRDYGTPEQIAQHLFDILFKEIGNVVDRYPYGHRNTLLDATAKDVGVGVTIGNGQVYLVHHQSSNGAFNGTSPKAGKYLDGTTTVYLNGNPVK